MRFEIDIIKKLTIKYKTLSLGVKATFWFFVCSIIQKGISIITVPVFTRFLTTEEYGIYSSYLSWLNVFLIFTTFKLNYGVFNKGMTQFKERKDEYTATMQVLTSILTFIFGIIYLIFRTFFNDLTELPTMILVLMIIQMFFNPAISFWSLRERYDLRYAKVVIITLAMAFVNPILGLIAVVHSQSPALARIISCIIVDVGFGICLYIHNLKRTKKKFSPQIARFAMFFNLPLIPHYFAEYVLDQSDRIMIQKICNKSDLGLYSVSYSAASVIKIFITSLNSALIPWLYHSLDEKNFNQIKRITKITCLIIGIPILVLILIAPELLKILAPVSYYSAVYVIPPVASSIYFVFLFGIYGNIEFYYNKNKFTMYVSSISAILNIVMNFFGIYVYGYIAAAYTTLICYFLLTLSHAIFIEKVCKGINNELILEEKFIWIFTMIFVILSLLFATLYEMRVLRYIILLFFLLLILIKRNFLITYCKMLKK